MKDNFMYKEIAGQWIGDVKGSNWGPLIINIDHNKTDEIGIMFNDQSGAYPLVLRSFISKYPGDSAYKGKLGFFKHFDSKTKQQVIPNNSQDFAHSGDVIFELKDKSVLMGEWKTSLGTKGEFEAKQRGLISASPIKKIISWADFKNIISKYIGTRGAYYFRGHQTSQYPLINSFNRQKCWNLDRYFENLSELFEGLGRSNLDRYNLYDPIDFGAGLHLAQHHGYPTPLMDWTLSPYIATYFAYRDFDREEYKTDSVRIFCFDQLRWSRDHIDIMQSGLLSPWVVIRPLSLSLGNNQRAIAQDAVSLFSNVENIEAELKDYIEYFDIDFHEQHIVLTELESMGIYEEHLFPDLHTFCKVHKRRYFGKE